MNEYDPLEKLTLLAAHAIDWRHIPSDYHRLTQMDVAARLAHLPRGASLLARVKYAGQLSLWPALVRELRTAVIQSKIPWPTKKKTRLPVLTEMALMEVLDPKVCRTCKGAGHLPEMGQDGKPTGKPIVCEHCSGGTKQYSEYSRYKQLDMHQEEWRRHWSRIYTEILTIPWEWESMVRRELKY